MNTAASKNNLGASTANFAAQGLLYIALREHSREAFEQVLGKHGYSTQAVEMHGLHQGYVDALPHAMWCSWREALLERTSFAPAGQRDAEREEAAFLTYARHVDPAITAQALRSNTVSADIAARWLAWQEALTFAFSF